MSVSSWMVSIASFQHSHVSKPGLAAAVHSILSGNSLSAVHAADGQMSAYEEKEEGSQITINTGSRPTVVRFSRQAKNFTFFRAVPLRVRAILDLAAPAGRLKAPERRRGLRPLTDAHESDR